MCKYCEYDEAGNLADIEHDGNYQITYLEEYIDEWQLVTKENTYCSGTYCWGKTRIHVNNCPMCGRRLVTT